MVMSDSRKAMFGVFLLTVAFLLSSISLEMYPTTSTSSSATTQQPSGISSLFYSLGPSQDTPEQVERRITEKRLQIDNLNALNDLLKKEQAEILDSLEQQQHTPSQPPQHPRQPPAQQQTKSSPVDMRQSLSGVLARPTIAQPSESGRSTKLAKGSLVTLKSTATDCFLELDDKGWLICKPGTTPLTPLRTFEIDQREDDWITLKSVAYNQYLEMVPPNQPLAWVLRLTQQVTPRGEWKWDGQRLKNRHSGSYLNIITDAHYAVRGHGGGNRKKNGAGTEPTTGLRAMSVMRSQLDSDAQTLAEHKTEAERQEQEWIRQIHAFPKSNEKRVVSYGLYGSNPKYVQGAVRNAELVPVYFPGWVARFYVDKTVPDHIIQKLKALNSEIILITDIKGGIAGMFWRFLVADDPTVDRYIVRDSDSRLNARERFAVEEWINSGKGIHTIRDHPNHERPLNGGMWGGTKGAVTGITTLIKQFQNKGKYGGDLHFLNQKIWPRIQNNQIGHDAYSCTKFPNSHPFPTKRPDNFQHVGQVFFEDDKARMGDIDNFMRGRRVPKECRKHPDWIYG